MNNVFWNVEPFFLLESKFRSKMSLPSSRWKESLGKKHLLFAVTGNFVPRPLNISAVKMEAMCSFEMSVLTSPTRHHIQGDGGLHSPLHVQRIPRMLGNRKFRSKI
jgi:hypothetical protein